MEEKAILVLEDGSIFYGKKCGKKGTVIGEICFNTGMTGYQEIFSDPSYFGQIVIMNNVHIGNYGLVFDEFESQGFKIEGLICRNYEKVNSRKDSTSIQKAFEHNLVGICDIDTRTLVSHIRSKGAMNCIISSEGYSISSLKEILRNHPKMSDRDLSLEVTTKNPYVIEGDSGYHVVVYDFGVKESILKILNGFFGITLTVVPSDTPFESLPECDGYFLSNGPGDPSSMKYAIENVKKIIKTNKPTFGICLGHQLISLANGVRTYKMKNGHRGSNHPVKILESKRCLITTQNHGFCISGDDVVENENLEITHIHMNDGTIAGIRMKNKPVFSVQFHPEAGPGPNDSKYLFTQFFYLLCQKTMN